MALLDEIATVCAEPSSGQGPAHPSHVPGPGRAQSSGGSRWEMNKAQAQVNGLSLLGAGPLPQAGGNDPPAAFWGDGLTATVL